MEIEKHYTNINFGSFSIQPKKSENPGGNSDGKHFLQKPHF